MPHRFLLEIGTEEIPDWMIPGALTHLKGAFIKLFEDNRLTGAVEWVDATPRRIVVLCQGLPNKQKDSTEIVSGPPKSAGEGAAQGFARKQGVDISALHVKKTPKGEYFTYKKKITGRKTADILAEALPGMILSIPWPKTMYWTAKNGPRFIRPIRWLVALFDSKIVKFEIGGVRSGNVSYGHRRLSRSRKGFRVTIANYELKLRDNFVLVRAGDRRARIENGIRELMPLACRLQEDTALLDTLSFITEYPTPILGNFSKEFLSLPKEVLVTVMRHHQKYFSLVNVSGGSLAPHFIAVMNTDGDPEGLVRAGNERVLRARFNDARFFWESDQKRRLADRVDGLKNVTFQKELGSYYDKTQRVAALVRQLDGGPDAERAAWLCKTDLTTDMVKEFTELQGVVGGLYAKAQGEPENVAAAIYEHYKPVSMDDSIPASRAGQIVSLADKLDTLRGCFGISLIPSGSKDPFALRRAAQGIVKILVEADHAIPFDSLPGGDEALREFLLDRARYYFREIRHFRYDEVNAVLAAGITTLADALARLQAVQAVRPTGNFEPLAASFKRIRNILEQAQFQGAAVDAALLSEEAERNLHQAMNGLNLAGLDYRGQLVAIASLRPHVDLFFDKVLVNAQDERIRTNRLALLDRLRREFSRIADFSEIVTG
jgi:glycyl-tRNA synthetase beta chain